MIFLFLALDCHLVCCAKCKRRILNIVYQKSTKMIPMYCNKSVHEGIKFVDDKHQNGMLYIEVYSKLLSLFQLGIVILVCCAKCKSGIS